MTADEPFPRLSQIAPPLFRSACLLALILPGAAMPTPEQDPPDRLRGIRFGRSLLALEDLDGDGHREIAVGAPTAEGDVFQAGLVLVLSGADRTVVQEWRGERLRKHCGHSLRSAGDVNGDGKADVLVGYEFGARTEVRSGVDGALLLAFDRLDVQVLPLGDADRDGAADFLLVSGSTMEARSGRDGSLLAGMLFIYADGSVHAAGDVDGDGLTDVILAAEEPVLWRSGRKESASLDETRLFHPGQRTALGELWPEEMERPGLEIRGVLPAGDLDGDGEPDLLLALRWEKRPRSSAFPSCTPHRCSGSRASAAPTTSSRWPETSTMTESETSFWGRSPTASCPSRSS